MKINIFSVETNDGWTLGATHFSCDSSIAKAVILFNSGTCILQKFYATFCQYLAKEQYEVISYDYRGVGQSPVKDLSDSNISIVNWAKQDMASMIRWAKAQFPQLPLYIVAHSMGGQVLGLCPAIHEVDKIVSISSSYGNWRFYSRRKYSTAFFVQLMFPLISFFRPVIPMKKFGLGEDYPKQIALELSQWYKKPLAYSQLMDRLNIPHFYPQITQPFKAIFINDDFIASPATIPYYQEDFSNAQLQVERIDPQENGFAQIGHMGFFQEKRQGLWPKVTDFLLDEKS